MKARRVCGEWRIEIIRENHASEEPGPGVTLIRITRGGSVLGDARTINMVKAVLARHGGPEIAEFGE
ncbi:hypothetical protein ABZW30_11275 [Kitasatospora sp. NPDC004669]|uniref:hypothetical protein n=1 Tax=Kitasatospora sp. NPDC004669 TaxID=3154555 RepID=UPI0033B55606